MKRRTVDVVHMYNGFNIIRYFEWTLQGLYFIGEDYHCLMSDSSLSPKEVSHSITII